MSTTTQAQYQSWIGKTEQCEDTVAAKPAAALAATLDKADFNAGIGQPLPPAWHWIYFQSAAPASQLGPDGHPRRGGFLPPIPLPGRMWAGSVLRFHEPIRIGDHLQRRSTIADITFKHGRSGPLAFVKVQHEYWRAEQCVLEEQHDIVYREATQAGATPAPLTAAPERGDWQRRVHPDPVLLFRYSALTFNGHRIHYDRSYCQEVEGYPGLIVHGPLIATLLLDLLTTSQPDPVCEFDFRARAPLFDTGDFNISGNRENAHQAKLWATNEQGQLCMQASAQLQPPSP